MASELDQASPKPEEEQELEPGNEREVTAIGIKIKVGQVVLNLKQLKSFEILKSAMKIITSNTKLMLFIILSILPFFAFMLFYEIKLQKAINYTPMFLQESPIDILVYPLSEINVSSSSGYSDYSDNHNEKPEFFSDFLQLIIFYLVLYPLLETFSMIITMKITAKVHAGEKQATLKQVLFQKNNFKGLSVTCICVHLLSNFTLLGLFWIVANHYIFTRDFDMYGYFFDPIEAGLYILSVLLHSVIFVALLYKYLNWSAFWNMSMVISVLEEETGIRAFGMSDYYGKHCKQTRFQLMLVFFVFSNFLRLPCLFAGLCSASVGGVVVAFIVIGLVCLGNVVKWVSFVSYFFDCKQQTLEKKADEEVVKPANASDLC